MAEWLNEGVLERAGQILRAGPICDECLGRGFAKLGRGLTNGARGRALRASLSAEPESPSCWVCNGLFAQIEGWARAAIDRSSTYEFNTYLFGVRLTPRLEEMEVFYNGRFPTEDGESLKHAINRALGLAFERCGGHGTVDFGSPDVSFLVDPGTGRVTMHVRSLFFYGRYRKLERGIPQTRWPCRACRGRGCEACQGTGKQYAESVQEWIGDPAVERVEGADHKFHGAGREDIDARMLGDGRPFILEVVAPKRRRPDLEALTEEINRRAHGRVEISPLRMVSRRAVGRIKEIAASKSYRAVVAFEGDVSAQALSDALSRLVGPIEQRTPQRVSHRRADKVRRRGVLAIDGSLETPRRGLVDVTGEGGLYIKELISGDEGRTAPSLAEQLGVGARVEALDVLSVASEEFEQLS